MHKPSWFSLVEPFLERITKSVEALAEQGEKDQERAEEMMEMRRTETAKTNKILEEQLQTLRDASGRVDQLEESRETAERAGGQYECYGCGVFYPPEKLLHSPIYNILVCEVCAPKFYSGELTPSPGD